MILWFICSVIFTLKRWHDFKYTIPFPPPTSTKSHFLCLSGLSFTHLWLFSPLALRPPIHPSNENLFSCLSLPVILSSLSSPSILHLLLMVISLPILSVLFPWHDYWQQQASVIFHFILTLAFPVSSSSPSVFSPKPAAQIPRPK